jgi:hypothetical protein
VRPWAAWGGRPTPGLGLRILPPLDSPADAQTNEGDVSDEDLKKILGDAAAKGIYFTIVGIGLECVGGVVGFDGVGDCHTPGVSSKEPN